MRLKTYHVFCSTAKNTGVAVSHHHFFLCGDLRTRHSVSLISLRLSHLVLSILISEEGDTKDDLELPTYPEGFGNEIQKQFDDGKTLVRQKQTGRQPAAETRGREGWWWV